MSSGKVSRGGRKSAAEPISMGIENDPVTSGAEGEASAEPEPPEVGRLVDSSQADDRRMIRLVRERRLLYARNNMPVASYYSRVKKLWQEVADNMGWTVADVRRKWSHIRNSYSRHLRNEMYGVRTGRGRMVSKWYLADELNFLREHMATDTRPSRYSYTPLYLKDVKPKKEPAALAQETSSDLQPFIATPWYALATSTAPTLLPPAPPPAPLEITPMEPQIRLEESSSPLTVETDESNAYFQFFRSIHPDYRDLPLRKQRFFRRECLNLMHRLLEDEDERRLSADREQTDAMNLSAAHSDDDQVIYIKQEFDREEGCHILP